MTTVSEKLAHPRLQREMQLQNAMIRIYCKNHHVYQGKICKECERLQSMTSRKLAFCNSGADKPTCLNCTNRCYTPVISKQVHTVYRYSRSRIWLRHPLLTLRYRLDGVFTNKTSKVSLLSQ